MNITRISIGVHWATLFVVVLTVCGCVPKGTVDDEIIDYINKGIFLFWWVSRMQAC
jgi:hypothetical protein